MREIKFVESWNKRFWYKQEKIAINEMEEIIFSKGKDKCETWEDTLFTFEGIYHYDGFFLSKIRDLHPDTYLSTADKKKFMNDYKYIIVKEKGDLKRKGIEDLSIGSMCFKSEKEREDFIVSHRDFLQGYTNSFDEIDTINKRKEILEKHGLVDDRFGLTRGIYKDSEDCMRIVLTGHPIVHIFNFKHESTSFPIFNPYPRSEDDIKTMVEKFNEMDMRLFRMLFINGSIILR